MGGLAALAIEAGHKVTGCDTGVYPPMSDQLRALGIELIEGYSEDQLALAPDMFVVGNVVSRARLPAGLGPKYPLMEAILNSGQHYTGNAFVIEADEYDTAFFDKRSKFVHYRPRTAVLNNLEFDHADIFDDLAAIERQFHHLLRTVPSQGRVVANAGEDSLQRVLSQGCWSETVLFGNSPLAHNGFTTRGEPHDFEVLRSGQRVAQVRWDISGVHNQLNALAAIAAAEHVGVPPAVAAEALAGFQNVKRRMEVRGVVHLSSPHERGDITVYDDFAHHPTAIHTTVDGLRRQLDALGKGADRILAIFEPRSNTMKLGAMTAQLPASLAQADLAFCHAGGLDWDARAALEPMGKRGQVADKLDELLAQVKAAVRPGDHLLCMSNGGFGGIHAKLLAALEP